MERDEDEHVDWHTVEQYVSNRLDPAIVSEITDHFAICTPCRGVLMPVKDANPKVRDEIMQRAVELGIGQSDQQQ